MTLAHVVASLESRHGGPSRSVRGIATALAQVGRPVELLTTVAGGAPVERDGTLTVHTFPREWPAAISPSASLRDHLRETDYTLVHNHGLWLRPLHYAHQAASRLRVPLVISPRGMMTPWAWNHHRARKWLAGNLLHPGAMAGAHGWHATSPAEADDIRRLGFNQPVCVAPNGIQLPTTNALMEARRFWLAQCPSLAGSRVALFYSRFHAKKRVLEIIELWHRQAPPDWIFLLVGIPEQYTVAELRAHVERLGATGRILVEDGADRPEPYATADIYVLPSHSENFGQTVLEALSSGIPVLTTDATPWSQLSHHDAGACVTWDTFDASLRGFLAEPPEVLRARGERGRLWAERDFAWHASAKTLLEFYDRLAGSAS